MVIVALVVALAVSSVFLLAYLSSERAVRPEESRWRAFCNGLRRRQPRTGPVEVSLAEMLHTAEPDAVAPFAAFDQVRQRAVEQAARAAGLAAALVAREPAVPEHDPFADLSFSELEIARAELTLAELTLARLALAEPDLPELASDEYVTFDDGPDPQDGTEQAERERAGTA